jgi:outer membrane protein OmpA-like peptidoglycan-associated protein
MRPLRSEAIVFHANPFIALADFLVVLLLVLIIAYLAQNLSSSSLAQRAAIATIQKDINVRMVSGLQQVPRLPADTFQEVYADGDLQRFQLRGDLAFDAKSWVLKTEGKEALSRFAAQIVRLQSNPRPYKRITLLGHADASEGSPGRSGEIARWDISQQRAREALLFLRDHTGINTSVLEVSGIGSNEDAVNPGAATPHGVAAANRRLDVIIIYSGDVAQSYQQSQSLPARRP